MRVVLIPSAILFLGMVAAVGATLFAARSRIVSETRSSVTVGKPAHRLCARKNGLGAGCGRGLHEAAGASWRKSATSAFIMRR